MRRNLSLIVPQVLAVVLLLPGHADAQKPRAERPTYQVGDKWIRSDGVYDLLRIENGLYVFAAEGGREVYVTKDLAIAEIKRHGVVEWEVSEPPSISWPLAVGNWGRGRVSRPAAPELFNGHQVNVVVVWKVEALEDVRVPAGVFRAFRITQSFMGELAAPTFGSVVLWYAPSVRQIVKATSSFPAFQAFEVVNIERTSPAEFRVALEGPAHGVHVTGERVAVVGKVTASPGVARVTVALNGREISKQEDKKAEKREVPLNLPVQLKEGENVLLVTAVDGRGEIRQEARTVFFDKPAPTAPPQAPVLPPFMVSVSAPADQAKVDQEKVTLAALASGGNGVHRLMVTLNGVEVARQEEPIAVASKAVNLELRLREGPNTVVVTATDAAGTSQQAARTIHYQKVMPLGLAVRYPADGLHVYEESSVVAAVIASSRGVASVSVSLNGVEVHQEVERTPPQSVTIAVPITLREGTNTLVVNAAEPDGTIRQEKRTVTYSRPQIAPVPTAAQPAAPPTRSRWAVVVGVGRHESREVPGLRYTVADADSVYQALIGRAGFQKDHILLLTDKTERKPTLRNIRWALGTFLSRSAQKDDTVLIFFAGHGAPEVDPRGVERDGLAKYLIPSDVDPDDLYSSALPMDELQTIFGRIEAERVVAFLDTCYSGAAGGRTFQSKKTRSSQVDDLFLDRLTRSKGRAIITASRPTEVSIELSELGHGVFSYYLVEGLNGAADLNHDGIVTLQELYEYLEQQVTQKSRAVGGNQHPVMKGELEGVLPLVKIGGR
jgi:hypothetical protein